MARTAIPVTVLAAYGGGDDDLTWTTADAANDHEISPPGGKSDLLLLHRNGDASPHTATLVSAASARTFQRTGDKTITTAAGEISAYAIPREGFIQSDGKIHVDLTDGTSCEFCVVQITPTP